MGVIFRRNVPTLILQASMANSVRGQIHVALMEQPPALADASARVEQLAQPAAQAAAEVARQQIGTVSIQPVPFMIAIGLFFVLLGVAVVLDWKHVVSDPKVYSGMATTVLGVVVGFFGGDAAGTASSS
jgi:hypothetical protein